MAFLIKQHDLEPDLPVQFFETEGGPPLPLDDATSVSIVVRKKGDLAVLWKRAITIDDEQDGLAHYAWQPGDTDDNGTYEYEFEILWDNGEPQTIPVDSYFEFIVVDDIG